MALLPLSQAQSDLPCKASTDQKRSSPLDESINAFFKPVTDAVEAVVFWTFDLKKDVVYGIKQEQPTPIGKDFYREPPFRLKYEEGQKVPYDQLIYVEAVSEGDYSIYLVCSLIDGEVHSSTFIPGQVGELNGFHFSLHPNPKSNHGLSQGEVYYCKPAKVTFLPFTVFILIAGAFFFTLAFRFINLRKFKLALDIVRGRYSDPKEKGEVSHFQALATAVSGTVGLGNIAGVAVAISLGGAGAVFWMILAGLMGMSTKFVECTLGVKYRHIKPNGEVSGGPMYYLSRGLAGRGIAGLGKVLAVFFAVTCIGASFGGGNMIQVNQAFDQVAGLHFMQGSWLANNGWAFGTHHGATGSSSHHRWDQKHRTGHR